MDAKSFINQLQQDFSLSDDYLKGLIPLVESIFDPATPIGMRETLMTQARECCAMHVRTQYALKNINNNLKETFDSINTMTSSLSDLYNTSSKFANHMEALVRVVTDDDGLTPKEDTRH